MFFILVVDFYIVYTSYIVLKKYSVECRFTQGFKARAIECVKSI